MTRYQQVPARIRLTVFGIATGLLILGSAIACSSSSSKAGGGTSASSTSTTASGTSASSATSGTSAASGNTIDIKNFSFAPMSLTVAVGTTVTWKFDDSAQHTVSADDKSFVSPAMSNGQTYTHTFTKAGTFSYICSIHQYMKGTIVVQ
jgi:plastocyanin